VKGGGYTILWAPSYGLSVEAYEDEEEPPDRTGSFRA